MEFVVRAAVPADAASIARIHVETWREAYADIMPAAFLASQTAERRLPMWESILASPRDTVAVALVNGLITGFASSGPSEDDDAPRPRQLFTMYQLASGYGSGIGTRLLSAVLGDEPAMLWVADPNPRAQAFYTKNGFRFDGTRKVIAMFGQDIAEVRMVR